MKRARNLLLGVSALAAATMPFLLSVPTASATVNTDSKTAAVTFVDNLGGTVTCTLHVNTTHDTDAATLELYSFTTGGVTCNTADLSFVATYKDDRGVVRKATGTATEAQFNDVVLPNVVSSISVDSSDRYRDCVSPPSATCTQTIHTSPK